MMALEISKLPFEQPRWLVYLRRMLMCFGLEFYLKMDDRRVLETIVLPYFQHQKNLQDVLFIGCDWYTRGYRKYFYGKNYWTMDFNPAQKKYGSNKHIVDACEHVSKHFGPSTLDLIICNGVYGYGLNELEKFEEAVLGFIASLRENGIFVLGWDDNPTRTPFPLTESQGMSLLGRYVLPPLGTSHYLTANEGRHTYDFFVKRTSHLKHVSE